MRDDSLQSDTAREANLLVLDPGLRVTAERLLATARNAHRDLRFGDRKVFLCAIVDVADPAAMDVLEDCRRAQLLTFARADLVAAMDPELVAAMDPELVEASEWRVDLATFHFLVLS